MKPNILLVAFAAVAIASSLHAEPQATGLIASASVLGMASATDASVKTLADKPELTKAALQKLFSNTVWIAQTGATVVFLRDGTMSSTQGGMGAFYTLEAPDILKVYQKNNPPTDLKAKFRLFRVNVPAMTAQQDSKASTMGGDFSLASSMERGL
jgi:hypothetical protein